VEKESFEVKEIVVETGINCCKMQKNLPLLNNNNNGTSTFEVQ
jgi:hypothetical protein